MMPASKLMPTLRSLCAMAPLRMSAKEFAELGITGHSGPARPAMGGWGILPRNVPRVRPPLAEDDITKLDHGAWVQELEGRVRRDAAHPARLQDMAAVRAKTQEEVAKGLMRGPFTKAQMDAAYGVGGWRPMHRFAVWQKGKCRPCDNAKASRHNRATTTFEALLLDRPDFPARVCAEMAAQAAQAGKDTPPMQAGTDDLADAYRHVPTDSPRDLGA